MTFDETLARVLDCLQREGRVSYRALRRRFDLDEDYFEVSGSEHPQVCRADAAVRQRVWARALQ